MAPHVASVVVYNGLNYSEWSEQVQFHLGALDLDLALLKDKPTTSTPTVTTTGTGTTATVVELVSLKDWEKSNRLSIMFIRMTVAPNIRSTWPTYEIA